MERSEARAGWALRILDPAALFLDGGPPVFGFEDSLLHRPGPFRLLPPLLLPIVAGLQHRFSFLFLNRPEQAFAGELAVGGLGTGLLDGDGDASGEMAEGDAGGDFVDVLSSGPR